jgi:hypothetical protein
MNQVVKTLAQLDANLIVPIEEALSDRSKALLALKTKQDTVNGVNIYFK